MHLCVWGGGGIEGNGTMQVSLKDLKTTVISGSHHDDSVSKMLITCTQIFSEICSLVGMASPWKESICTEHDVVLFYSLHLHFILNNVTLISSLFPSSLGSQKKQQLFPKY
jgi:hypothetical protein